MIKKHPLIKWFFSLILALLLFSLQISASTDTKAPLSPAAEDKAVMPGTYLLIAYADKETVSSISDEEARNMTDPALFYYKASGTVQCIVVSEDQTASQHWDYGYLPALFEDGYFYTVGGESYMINGSILAIGFDDTTFDWSVYYRLTPDQAASLSYSEEALLPESSILKIPLLSDQEYSALMSVVSPVLDAGGDPNDVYDEVLLSIDKVNETSKQKEKDRMQEDFGWDQFQMGFLPDQFETFEESQITMARIMQLNNGSVPVGIENGQVTFIGGSCTEEPIEDQWDAMEVLERTISLLGGDQTFEFEPWGVLEDSTGNQYYTFQQFKNAVSVSGGAVKIAVNKDHRMTGIFSSIVTDLPEEEPDIVPYTELRDIVLDKSGFPGESLTFYEGTLDVTLLPLIIDPDPENDEPEDSTSVRYVWIVYTNNPAVLSGSAENYPYLAHYITMEGEYLYHSSIIAPGDAASVSGFSADYTFIGMEPDTWTGSIILPGGKEQTVTLPVMRNPETGVYCLADPERRIVMADCYDFMHNDYQITFVSSETNGSWDPYYLGIYYNMIRVWDFYRNVGWSGADGENTPILVLVDYCDADHEPVDNAAYMGLIHGWQTFGFSNSNVYGLALDVVAHEFTHCVTSKSMTFNSYLNDYGAINESISDIMGNICESFYKSAGDESWLIAEDSGTVLRSMSDPHLYSMPEAVWDLYYFPHAGIPTEANDRGGVHINSSILNRIAYRLWAEAGMSLEESRDFWTSVECAMVPGTNFCQLSIVLPWVMEEIGLRRYTDRLEEYIKDARLSELSLPAETGEDRALLILELPENEVFTDGYWLLYLMDLDLFGDLQANTASEEKKLTPVYDLHQDGFAPDTGEGDDTEPETSRDEDEAGGNSTDEEDSFLSDLLKKQFSGAGTDGHTIRMMTKPGDKMIFLLHLSEENLADPDIMMILSGGVWKNYSSPDEGSYDSNLTDTPPTGDDPFHQSDGDIYTIRHGYNILPAAGLDILLP